MRAPCEEDVLALLGRSDSEDERVTAALEIIGAMAHAYTRGRGFRDGEPNDEIAAVIITATARLASNSEQTSRSESLGEMTADVRSYFQGWNLAEQSVLNRYRVRAM